MKSIKELQDENIEKALGTIENAIAFDNEDKGNALACLELIKEKLETNKEYIREINAKNKELLTKLTKVCNAFYKSYNYLLGCEQYNLMSIKNNEYERELYNIIDEVQNGKKED